MSRLYSWRLAQGDRRALAAAGCESAPLAAGGFDLKFLDPPTLLRYLARIERDNIQARFREVLMQGLTMRRTRAARGCRTPLHAAAP
jgi:hypothetical protein